MTSKIYARALTELIKKGRTPRREPRRGTTAEIRESEEGPVGGTLVIGDPIPVPPESEPGSSTLDRIYSTLGPDQPGGRALRRPRALCHMNVNMKEYEKVIVKTFARKLGLSFADWARRVMLREVKRCLDTGELTVPPLIILSDSEAQLQTTKVRGPHRKFYKAKAKSKKTNADT